MRARTAFLVGNLVAIAASFLIGAGTIPAPTTVGVVLAFYTLFIVPGFAAGNLLLGRSAPALEMICGTFCGGAVFVSSVVSLGFVPGVSYGAISAVAAILAGLAALIDARYSRSAAADVAPKAGSRRVGAAPAGRGSRGMAAALLLFAVCFAFFYGSGELGWSTDAPDHVSYMRRSLETGSLFPADSFYRDGDGASFDIRKGLWQPALSLWAHRAHAAPDVLWKLLPACLGYFALAAFLFFGVELLGSTAFAALGLAFMLLFYGGEGVTWLTKIGFGRNGMQMLFWAAAAFLLRYYRLGGSRYLAAVALVSAAGCAFHLVFALLIGVLLIGVLCYALASRVGALWRRRLAWSALAVGAGLAAPIIARARFMGAAMNEIHTHRQGMLVFSPHLAMVDPVEILVRMGLLFFFSILAMPFFFLVAPRPKRALVFTLTIVPVLLVLNPLLAPTLERHLGYLHYRMLEAAPLMFFAALMTWGLVRLLIVGGKERGIGNVTRRLGAVFGLILFLYYPVRAAVPRFAGSVVSIIRRDGELPSTFTSFLGALERTAPRHAVIVSDPMTSYGLSAFTDHFVVVSLDQHGSPTDSAALERLRDVRDLLSPGVPLSESLPALRRWDADYVLLNTNLPADADFFGTVDREHLALVLKKLRSCPRLLRRALEQDGFMLFAVQRDPSAARADSCDAVVAPPLTCGEGGERREGIDVGCGVLLEGIFMDAETLAAGDTLRGHFCWRATEEIRFGLPVELTVRLDGVFPKGRWYRDWYGKQYRRIVERRRQVSYRETRSERLASGATMPDQWQPGEIVREPFALAVSPWTAPGRYDIRVKVWRKAYLPNRSLSDYLSNEDSLEGTAAAAVVVEAPRTDRVTRRAPGAGAGEER